MATEVASGCRHRIGRGMVAVVALVTAAGCGDSAVESPPGQLSFDTILDVADPPADGADLAETGTDAATAGPADTTRGVIVGAVVGSSITARRGPAVDAAAVVELSNPTDVGGPLVFQLVDPDPVDLRPDAWVEVHLPIRPNGSTGWVRVGELALSRNPYRIEIDAGDHRLEVWRDGQLWLETTVGIGTGATPTPRGRFSIIELLQPPDPDGLYGPYAFGLSGFSETLRSFAGGDGVIGIHGTDTPEALGTDVSHGCIRVHNDVITELAGVIPLGTPVDITD